MIELQFNVLQVSESLQGQSSAAQTINDLLETGYKQFDKFQYGDALQCFSKILELDPGNEQARQAHNQVIQLIVPRWHFSMLNDRERNESYDAAIREAVDSSKTVLDVGSGSGLLAMMAARAGAKMTYTCEMNETIADLAKLIVDANGYGERIKVIGKKSNDLILGVDIPEKVDVLITETLDSGLLGEGIIPIIHDAKKRLLVDGGQIIPRGARVYAALVDAQSIWELNHVTLASGFNVNLFNNFSTSGFYPVRLERFEHKFLTEPIEVCAFDFMLDKLEQRHFNFSLAAVQEGLCHAVAFWFDLYLDEHNSFSSSPNNLSSHWKQALQPLRNPVPFKKNQELNLLARQDMTSIKFELALG